jgi:transcriptional regulator of NAD metabolism
MCKEPEEKESCSMNGEERRAHILHTLKTSSEPVSGSAFARELHVSRQVIVQDIALIRSSGVEVLSGKYGYFIYKNQPVSRVFKVYHTDEETEEEMNLYVDLGGRIDDVFVYHKIYGIVRAPMNIKSRREIRAYMKSLETGSSSPLKNITGGYHYHTISADSEDVLNDIQEALSRRGFLAKLQDYEPVNFWKNDLPDQSE